MNKRTTLTLLAWVLCIGSGWAVWLQHKQLTALRGEQKQIAENAGEPTQNSPASPDTVETIQGVASLPEGSHELLQLRSEVTRLTARKRELAGVPGESERLRARLANSVTNGPGGIRLPPGYIRKGEAQMVGYSTPENTLQSFLWALQHHDTTNVLQAMSPTWAQSLVSQIQQSPNAETDFFKSMAPLPGFAIQGHQDLPDGSVELQVQFGDDAQREKIRLLPFNGEWKLEGRF